MKLVCPGCMKNVDVPESALGTDYPCLICGTKIPVPKTYTPSVAVPPPPPSAAVTPAASAPPIPPAPPGLAPHTAPPALPTTTVPGDAKEIGFTLTPQFMSWVTPVSLSLAFVLTFFTWVGAYPGGHRLFAQSAWGAMGRELSPNTVGIAELDKVEKELGEILVNSKWLIPYLLLLVIAVAFAWVERLVKDLKPTTVPGAFAWILPIWPMRFRLLTILCGVLLFLFLLQSWRGFGLENAVRDHAAKKFEADVKAADTQAARDKVTVLQGQDVAKYAVQSTNWYWLALFANVAAVLGMVGRTWFSKREGKPAPQFLIRY